jgi:hypothetical protein
MASLLTRAFVSGTVAGIATAIAASLAGRRAAGSYAAPLNATSHVAWGNAAARENQLSLKHTASGFALNHGACVFWALFYEWFAGPRPSRSRAATGGAAVAAAAYVIDYHVVPQRLTPGFELRLPARALALIYVALGAGLACRDLLMSHGPRRPGRTRPVERPASTMTGFAASPDKRDVIEQAESDLERGLEDTDCRGMH